MSPTTLDTILATAVDGIILTDSKGSITVFNAACERLFGYRAVETIGQNIAMLMPEPYSSRHDDYIARYLETREHKIIGIGREVAGRRRDGSTFPMYLSVGESRENGASVFVGIIRDLTSFKKTEAQLVQAQKMEAMGQLAGGIAHDFNNLLTVIVGSAELVSEGLSENDDLKPLADAVVTAGERGADLTRRMLALGRRQTLKPGDADCNELIESITEMLRRTLRDDVELRTVLEPGIARCFVDASQLETSILNLCVNARDAMPEGGSIAIRTENVELDETYRLLYPEVPPGTYVAISVADDGAGMPPEVLERVYEPFFTTKETGKGTGLGLSMVYGFVKQSGGHIAIYSEVGLGTTVRIYLPASGAVAEAAAPAPVEAPLPGTGGETILLVEDDASVQAYGIAVLKSLGYRPVTASSGKEAIALLEEGLPVDLILTDVVMPGGVSGWDLAERARVLRPGVKIVVASGYAPETISRHHRVDPSVRTVEKPFRKALLARIIRDTLDGR
jgi:PAS domain S-box-containing protein